MQSHQATPKLLKWSIPAKKPSTNKWKTLSHIAEKTPEATYISGFTMTDVLLADSATLPSNTEIGIGVSWSYIDGVCAIMNGIALLNDEENYRQTQNKIKGVLNIIAGSSMLLFSYNRGMINYGTAALASATALAAPMFAFATFCDLINAGIDYCNALNELDFEGWLDQRLKEVEYIQKRLNNSDLTPAKKIELQKKKHTLIDDIESRCRVYVNSGKTMDETAAREKFVINACRPYSFENESSNKTKILNSALVHSFMLPPTAIDKKRNAGIEVKLNEIYKTSRNNLFFKALSFVGAALLAVSAFVACPGLAIVGAVAAGIVVGRYVYKNGLSKLGLFSSPCEPSLSIIASVAPPSLRV